MTFLVAIYDAMEQSYSVLGLTEKECRAVINEKIASTTILWDGENYDEEGVFLTRSNMASVCLKHFEDWGWLKQDYDETLNSYVVTFNANGGTVSPTSRTVNYGSQIGTLPTPTRQYHTFLGWYTSATGGSQVYSNTKVRSAMTIYAHWRRDAVAYVKNGSSWKRGSVYMKSGGSWKRGAAYVKNGGSWKRGVGR